MSKAPDPPVYITREDVRELMRNPENFKDKIEEIMRKRQLEKMHLQLSERR